MLRPAGPWTSTLWLEDRIREATERKASDVPRRNDPRRDRRRVLLSVPSRWARTLVALRLASVPRDYRGSAIP